MHFLNVFAGSANMQNPYKTGLGKWLNMDLGLGFSRQVRSLLFSTVFKPKWLNDLNAWILLSFLSI